MLAQHYNTQLEDLKRLSKGKGITDVLRLKHKYMVRCSKLYWMGMYAIHYGDGTDKKLFDRATFRRKFYIQKLLNL